MRKSGGGRGAMTDGGAEMSRAEGASVAGGVKLGAEQQSCQAGREPEGNDPGSV